MRGRLKTLRGCPSLVGGRPAKPVVRLGRAGSNPAPRANSEHAAQNLYMSHEIL